MNYTPVSQSYPASTPSSITAQAGDTLRGAVRMAFHGKVDVAAAIADAFGNVLGDNLAQAMMPTIEPPPAARQPRVDDNLDEVEVTALRFATPDKNPAFELNLDVMHPTADETREGIAKYGGVDRTATVNAPDELALTELSPSEQRPAAPRAHIAEIPLRSRTGP